MADSFIQLNNDGPGKKVDTRTESTNGDHRQVMVIGDPITNTNVANVTAAGGVQVDGSGVTQPISVASLPLPAGAATSTNQSMTQTILSSILTNTPSAGQAVMASSSPVVIASNQSAVPVILASTTVTGNVTVVQPTGTNLHTVVDSGTITLSGTSPVSGTVTANQGIAATASGSWPVEVTDGTNILGTSSHPLRVDPTGITTQPISGTVTTTPPSNASTNVTQFGGVNISTGTGASGTGIPRVTVSNDSNVLTTQSGIWTVQPGNTPNTTPWLITIEQGGNTAQVNASGEQLVTDTDLTLAQGSTTTGQLGPLVQGAVTTAAPVYITAQTSPLSLTIAGALRTDASATTQPVSGTITTNQGTANATPWNENIAQIGGSAINTAAVGIQKVGITGNTAAVLDGAITAATAPANGLAILTVTQTTPPSLTAGQSVAVQCDYVGSVFVKPYRRSQTTSKATTIAASTTTTTVLAAQAAGIFADISSLIVTATPGSTGTAFTITLSDGTNSYIYDMDTGSTTTLVQNGILNLSFNPPLPATTAATAWTITNSSATPTIHITVVAVLQKAS